MKSDNKKNKSLIELGLEYYYKSKSIKIGVWLTLLSIAVSAWYLCSKTFPDIVFEGRNMLTFVMLGWNLLILCYNREKGDFTLTEGKFKDNPQTIKVTRKQKKSISDLTNIVSAKFYGGGQVEGVVRNQLFVIAEIITEEEMDKRNEQASNPTPAIDAKEQEYRAAISSGKLFWENGEFEKALEKYKEAETINPQGLLHKNAIQFLEKEIASRKSVKVTEGNHG